MISCKGFVTILLVGACVLMSYSVGFAQLTPANADAVVGVANNWLHLGQEMGWGWATVPDFSASSIQELEYQGEVLAYNLPTPDGGHILIPACLELPPITAYSTVASLDVTEENGFSGMLKEILSLKFQLLRDYLTNPDPPPELMALQDEIDRNAALWQAYTSSYQTFTRVIEEKNAQGRMDSEDEVQTLYSILDFGPLLSSNWHQEAPYNDFCPWGDGGRCVVGCVATAMAQIMKYWNYPPNGSGSRTYYWNGDQSCGGSTSGQYLSATFSDAYDWANIRNSYSGSESQAEKDAVAELCYEAGVAVAMDYGYCASGSNHARVLAAFPNYFEYSSQIDAEYRDNYSSWTTWFNMLVAELNNNRPIQYGVEAHSIVCDGWRVSGTNQLHMNYGWGGYYNGWYNVDDIHLGGIWVEMCIRYIIGEPFMRITAPSGGQMWCVGTEHDITWSGAGFTGRVTISIDRDYPSGSWDVLFAATDNDGSETWTVTGPATSDARIRIMSDSDPDIGDTLDGDFIISDPYILVSAPNGGETWYVTQSRTIYWSSCGLTGNVDVSINRDFPNGNWVPLFTDTPDDGYEQWVVTEPATNNARIRVVSISDPQIRDSSDSDFSIGTRYIAVTDPNGGETWYVGETDTVRWASENVSGTVTIMMNRSYPAGYWENIAVSTANDGEHPWGVTMPPTTQARIRIISDSYSGVGDTSNGNFIITDQGAITVVFPNGGEVWFVGETEDITWTSGGITGNVMIELDRDYPSSWDTLFESTADDGIESWEVAGLATSDARVRISSVSEPDVYDISNADFSIDAGSPPVILHDAKDDGEPGSILFVATVTADVPPTVRLFWRPEGSGSYDSTGMVGTGNPDEYSAMVSLPEAGKYEYYLKAEGLAYQVTETGVYDFDLYPSCGLGLWYDDGGAERYNWAGDTRFRWAVRFTPESVPYILCGAWFSVSRTRPDWSHQRVRIEVYDSDGPGGFPGTVLLRDTTGCIGNVVGGLPPDQTYWAGAHLRDGAGEPLVFNGDFYVAVGNPDSAGYEAFSRDTTGSVSGRSYLYDGCLEQWYLESDVWENCRDGNRLIRVVGYYQEPPVLVVTQSGDDAALSWTPSGSPYYRVYSDTTPLGAFGTFEGSTSDTTFVDVNAVTDGVIKFYQVTSSTQP